jgi:hemoglobin
LFSFKKSITVSIKNDINNKEDIEIFVNRFYDRVQQDNLLSPVFASRIPKEVWPEHLQRMYAFWNALLFSETGFNGNPMQKHMTLPIEEKHFSQWLSLFTRTIDELYSGPKAEEAKMRAASIARIMNFKIDALKNT